MNTDVHFHVLRLGQVRTDQRHEDVTSKVLGKHNLGEPDLPPLLSRTFLHSQRLLGLLVVQVKGKAYLGVLLSVQQRLVVGALCESFDEGFSLAASLRRIET